MSSVTKIRSLKPKRSLIKTGDVMSSSIHNYRSYVDEKGSCIEGFHTLGYRRVKIQSNLDRKKGTKEIARKYASLGGPLGFLNEPIGPVRRIGAGIYRVYEGGRIYWSPETGAHVLYGPVLTHYLHLVKQNVSIDHNHSSRMNYFCGGPIGLLGFPKTDVNSGERENSRKAIFEYGAIYFSSKTGAFAVTGSVFSNYLSMGAEKSFLGLPISDDKAVCKRCNGPESISICVKCEFENGTIYWSKDCRGVFESITRREESLKRKKETLTRRQ